MKRNKGISLALLLITVIIIVIMTGAILISFSGNNVINKADEYAFKSNVETYTSELKISISKEYYNNILFAPSTFNKGAWDGGTAIDTVKQYIPSMREEDGTKFEIKKGKLVFVGTDPNEQEWAEKIGIEVIVAGEPRVTITSSSDTVVKTGIDVKYTVEFSSDVGISTINLMDDNVEVLNINGTSLVTEPDIVIGTISGTELDSTRSVDITIKTDTLSNGTYKLRIKAGSVTNENNISTRTDATSLVNFTIDNSAPDNPILIANPTGWTNGDVTVTITYGDDATIKEYSTNGTDWNNYIIPITVSTNNTTVYAKSTDAAGNQSGQSTLTVANIDNSAPENPTMVANPTGWTNGNVQVTITYALDSAAKEYSTNGTTWISYTSPISVSSNNTTVYAKSTDEAGNPSGQSTLTVANIDKDLPIIEYGNNGGAVETASTTVSVSDIAGSGINTSTLQYVWDTQNVTTPSSGWATFTNGATITSVSTNGTYYLWIKATDNVGNSAVSKTNEFVITQVESASGPRLKTGMTAKKWNGSSWVTVADPATDTTWYNYDNKEWANAQTADGSMWVWIPRYEYKITTPHSSTPQTIAVNILEDTTTPATSGYTIHPAFTFGSVELTGIWVAKFEASGTITSVEVKPSVTALGTITMDAMFTACRNMETTYGDRYGWGTTGTGIDTHLMKNIEWGAVAYLTQSVYGKNSEVWINPNSNHITGQAGTSASAASTTSTNAYDTANGVNASTTGNVYGVYDMSGGSEEYVAAYVNNGSGFLAAKGASLLNAEIKYKDVYTPSTGNIFSACGDDDEDNYQLASNKKGDAVYETSTAGTGYTAWYADNSSMPYDSAAFFMRSYYYLRDTSAGIFYFGRTDGYGNVSDGFRPVLLVSSEL